LQVTRLCSTRTIRDFTSNEAVVESICFPIPYYFCRQKQAARAGRKDARLRAVSITERWDKKAAKYNAPTLPYPFTSKQAFEGSMRQPLGADFNTQTSFK